MKIVIFAAGEGKRMRPLTADMPKPLLRYRGQTNLDHLFALLPAKIDEAIITVDYLAEKVRDYCGEVFHGRTMRYVTGSQQGNLVGFLRTREFFSPGERFAVAYGDEVFAGDEIARCLEHEFAWLCYEVADPTSTGVVTLDPDGYIVDFVEKPARPESNLAADGFMVVNTGIFDGSDVARVQGEQYFSVCMGEFTRQHRVRAVLGSPGHGQLTTPADIDRLNSAV